MAMELVKINLYNSKYIKNIKTFIVFVNFQRSSIACLHGNNFKLNLPKKTVHPETIPADAHVGYSSVGSFCWILTYIDNIKLERAEFSTS